MVLGVGFVTDFVIRRTAIEATQSSAHRRSVNPSSRLNAQRLGLGAGLLGRPFDHALGIGPRGFVIGFPLIFPHAGAPGKPCAGALGAAADGLRLFGGGGRDRCWAGIGCLSQRGRRSDQQT